MHGSSYSFTAPPTAYSSHIGIWQFFEDVSHKVFSKLKHNFLGSDISSYSYSDPYSAYSVHPEISYDPHSYHHDHHSHDDHHHDFDSHYYHDHHHDHDDHQFIPHTDSHDHDHDFSSMSMPGSPPSSPISAPPSSASDSGPSSESTSATYRRVGKQRRKRDAKPQLE